MLQVRGKALGSRKPLFADFSVPMPTGSDGKGLAGKEITLRELIEIVVRNEVEAFRQRQTDRKFLRVLSPSEIEQGEVAGKIEMGDSDLEPQSVDPDAAVENALQAFSDGIYLVAVDEVECRQLDEPIPVGEDSTVTFIRMTLLAGG